ncbi:hypothetical protein H5410_049538 [Solanum commersonii]|uniref:Uncharacterized protein n=1 Tax=Solanum commersonii TaxID=4109 RepID=A0A9J5WUC8_SOLCO|nr:hypothetical protein H5410_049538 [Solanum commersonii]
MKLTFQNDHSIEYLLMYGGKFGVLVFFVVWEPPAEQKIFWPPAEQRVVWVIFISCWWGAGFFEIDFSD